MSVQDECQCPLRHLFEDAEGFCRVDGRILFGGPDILGMPVLTLLIERDQAMPNIPF